MRLVTFLLVTLAGLLVTLAGPAAAQTPTIGPGTPCTITAVNPTTNRDGTALTVPLVKMSFYLDPPAGGPVIGTAVPAFALPVPNGAPGASNTYPLCGSVTTPISSGNHTGSLTWTDAGGEGLATAPSPFVFIGIGPGLGSGVTYR